MNRDAVGLNGILLLITVQVVPPSRLLASETGTLLPDGLLYTAKTVDGFLGSSATSVAEVAEGIRFVQLIPESTLFNSPDDVAAYSVDDEDDEIASAFT